MSSKGKRGESKEAKVGIKEERFVSPSSATPSTGGCRYDSSLGLLTKKFLALVEGAESGILDLNQAADTLHVQKRRIYDITNVLEGIGLIEKKSKNNIQWKGVCSGVSGSSQTEVGELQKEIESLRENERALDDHIKAMRNSLQDLIEDKDNKDLLYVTEDDIKGLHCFANERLIAVKAPLGTTLEVPDPEENVDYPARRYQIILKSDSGAIDVYLVNEKEQGVPASPIPGMMDMREEEDFNQHEQAVHSLVNSPGSFLKIAPFEANYWLEEQTAPPVGLADIFPNGDEDPAELFLNNRNFE